MNGSIDFERQEMDIAGIWFRAPRTQWIALLIPQILAAAQAGKEVTVSTYRQSFGYSSPDNYTLPAGDNFVLKLYAPMGHPWPSNQWGCLHYFDSRRPPCPGDRFVWEADGLRHQLQREFTDKFVDGLRQLGGRVRCEYWCRPNLTIEQLAPGIFPMPKMMQETIGLSAEEAAQRVRAMRCAQPASAYHQLRERERAAKQAEEAAELESATEAAEPDAVRAYCDKLSNTISTDPASTYPLPVGPQTPQEAPAEKTQREMVRDAKKLRSKLSRAVKSKVQADAKDRANAKAHADKVVARLEKAGRL
jgi:hypothetical protein